MDAPIVVGVQGSAAGAGLGLAAGGDIVIAAASARFVVAYTRIGLNPDGGTSFLLPRLVGLRRAPVAPGHERTRRCRHRGGDRARHSGRRRRARSTPRSKRSPAPLPRGLVRGQGEAKRLLRTSLDDSLALHLEAEAAAIVRSAERPDAREGIAAFIDKRPPRDVT